VVSGLKVTPWLWELWIDDDSSWSFQALASTKALYREQAAVAKAERKKFKQLRGWNNRVSEKHMGVSKNCGTPKWMVYNGKPYQNG